MNTIKCTLFCHSISGHTQQLYTGFDLLSASKVIEVNQIINRNKIINKTKKQYLRNADNACLSVQLSFENKKKINVYYDNHDAVEISSKNINNHDIYFKRSYSEEYIKNNFPERKDDIYPLGLNYFVLPNQFSRLSMYRQIMLSRTIKDKVATIAHSLDQNNKIKFYPKVNNMHAFPKEYHKLRVLFMATAYDPYDTHDRPKEKIEERICNNEMRANCIRLLRKELGDKFYGGFIHNSYTTKMYKDVLLVDQDSGLKGNYIGILNEFPICIATTGLHGSIGWKFAEYVAFSKAILSEKLRYKVPGNLEKNKNYLEFTTPEECVSQSIKLLSNSQLMNEIINNNSTYYQHYARPDMLVLNSILLCIKKWLNYD